MGQKNRTFQLNLLILIILSVWVEFSVQSNYVVSVTRMNSLKPVISSQYTTTGGSTFVYNYNAAYIKLPGEIDALLVRCQNLSDPSNPYSSTSSVIALAQTTTGSATATLHSITFDDITDDDIVLQSSGEDDNFGTEDPRCFYRTATRTYYMMYSAVQQYSNGTVISRLSCATSQDGKSWTKQGPVFSDGGWSKSGAVLIRSSFSEETMSIIDRSIMFWGDSSLVPGIQIAYPIDETLLKWKSLPGVWLPVRNDSFDSYLVEAGPEPVQLSDGNYLLIYNSARCCYSSDKPGYNLQYNVGWVILNGTNPSQILQRSDVPLMSPELLWERGYPSPPNLGLTPNVVFVEGIQQYDTNQFLIYYGAADSVIGTALVDVNIQS